MQSDESEDNDVNREVSIDESREPDSNETTARDAQFKKQHAPIRVTAEGMQIDESAGQFENVSRGTQETFEPGSNVTVDKDRHDSKQAVPNVSTEEGI
jgi:hypothetical protein